MIVQCMCSTYNTLDELAPGLSKGSGLFSCERDPGSYEGSLKTAPDPANKRVLESTEATKTL
jgi:hypothetical protein